MKKQTVNASKSGKRILSVTIRHIIDESPDTSWLGEYSSRATSEFSIDRAHSEDCASGREDIKQAKQTLEHVQQTIGDLHNSVLAQYNGTLANEKLDAERDALNSAYDEVGELFDYIDECDCGERGDMGRNEYRYFNPSFNYVNKAGKAVPGHTPEEIRANVKQDYDRMEKLNRGDFCFIGIRADAEVITDGRALFGKPVQTITSGGIWGIESDSEDSYIEEEEKNQLSELRAQLKALGFSSRAISTAFKNVQRKDS